MPIRNFCNPKWAQDSILKSVTNWLIYTWKPIQKLQDKSVRIISNSPYNCPLNPIYKKLKIMKVKDLIQTSSLCYAWKAFHSKLPTAISDIIDKGSERNLAIKSKNYKTEKIKKISPLNHITQTWNNLPLSIKRTPTLKSFQKTRMKFVIDNYWKNIIK